MERFTFILDIFLCDENGELQLYCDSSFGQRRKSVFETLEYLYEPSDMCGVCEIVKNLNSIGSTPKKIFEKSLNTLREIRKERLLLADNNGQTRRLLEYSARDSAKEDTVILGTRLSLRKAWDKLKPISLINCERVRSNLFFFGHSGDLNPARIRILPNRLLCTRDFKQYPAAPSERLLVLPLGPLSFFFFLCTRTAIVNCVVSSLPGWSSSPHS